MLPRGSHVIAAVSGGPDSVCLLHLLRGLAPELGFELAGVAHVNHQLRGIESDQDEHFVRELARSFGLPAHVTRASIDPRQNLEQAARLARRAFFCKLIDGGLADRIALGHTRDDQAETVLFRILRGSGITGLAGILPVTAEGIVRPMLDLRRADVLRHLRADHIVWREDGSNQSPNFARNRIRHQLLPQLERDWNPGLSDALAHLADVAYQEEVDLANQTAELACQILAPYHAAIEIDLARLAPLAVAQQRRLIRLAAARVVPPGDGARPRLGFNDVERILSMLGGSSGQASPARRSLPGLTAIRSHGSLLIAPPGFAVDAPAVALSRPGRYLWPACNPLIQLDIVDHRQAAVSPSDPCDTLRVSLDDVELRGWHAGDQYRPVGRRRVMKLKELFQRARVPSWRRPAWPILTFKGKIVWTQQFGPAAGVAHWRIREGSSVSVNPSGAPQRL